MFERRQCRIAFFIWIGVAGGALACKPTTSPATIRTTTPPVIHPRALAAIAKANNRPNDPRSQRAAGSALIEATLEGQLELAPVAERYLERALALRPGDLTAARKLSRLLNLRLVRGDLSRASQQLQLLDRLRREVDDAYERFVFDCFYQVAAAATKQNHGRPLAALHQLRALEQRLDSRLQRHPAEAETAAMAGNYALAFAHRLPTRRRKRLRNASSYFRTQQLHWDSQSVVSRGRGTAPGTRSVFAMWLAQVELAQGQTDAANAAFAIVLAEGQRTDATVAMRQLADEARRLQQTSAVHPRWRQSVAWPSAGASCIGCHSIHSTLPAGPSGVSHSSVLPP